MHRPPYFVVSKAWDKVNERLYLDYSQIKKGDIVNWLIHDGYQHTAIVVEEGVDKYTVQVLMAGGTNPLTGETTGKYRRVRYERLDQHGGKYIIIRPKK